MAESGMKALPVVEHLDVVEHCHFRLLAGMEATMMNVLDLERGKHALHRRVVQAIAAAAHRLNEAVPLQNGPIRLRSVLSPTIAVVDQTR